MKVLGELLEPNSHYFQQKAGTKYLKNTNIGLFGLYFKTRDRGIIASGTRT